MTEKKAKKYLKELKALAKDYGVWKVAKELLENEKFFLWSAASKDFQHHYGDYGLVTHTYEVVTSALKMKKFYSQYNINEAELFLACLFHDAGKMHDYERWTECMTTEYQFMNGTKVASDPEKRGQWRSADHKRIIHHISRSGIIWSDAAQKDQRVYDKYFEPVLHAILAHHGRREWGSPVSPKSRVAWLLFLCDGISARMYDADTMDRIN